MTTSIKTKIDGDTIVPTTPDTAVKQRGKPNAKANQGPTPTSGAAGAGQVNTEEAVRQRARIETVLARLEARYGVAEWYARLGPVDELVACILSQHTSDLNSGRAFDKLKATYAGWQSVVDAPVQELADTIRSGGLANSKAPRIQTVLRILKEQQGEYSLNCLDSMTDAEARAYLMALPGVGPKTAAIVLSFALNRPVIPVDTHIFRVSWRLGLIDKKIGEAKAHDALQAQVPPEIIYRFHVALITHGRQICKAPIPRCPECPVTDVCRYYHEVELPKRTAQQNNPQDAVPNAKRIETQDELHISSEVHDAPL